ncbi:uracil-DNA glycosylase family protein [Algiphilus aromaticivorans]|uniref:uracil-DNA glycosylase family protein n=1 Tax=Algiphilus aromaticivorans TaxID=382454 RepID=UPI0005C1D2B3|nr:uracil-DNA glycosylase family protein [Algiphilus aromaticivorans]
MSLTTISRDLSAAVSKLRFSDPVAYIYNPLDYAREPHETYLARFGTGPREILMLGMNPGPFGMAQTGVPFGDVGIVRDWMGIESEVGKPDPEHPKRPVQGFDCPRSEVSGTRLWGWARERFGSPEAFFARFFVANYCPLVFMEDSGRNRTPDKLPAAEREALYAVCDDALRKTAEALQPQLIIGIGAFAKQRAQAALSGLGYEIGSVLHPSPASPAANRGWTEAVERQLRDDLSVALPD